MTWVLMVVNLIVLGACFWSINRMAHHAKAGGYYQGRLDEAVARQEATSPADFLFISRAQIAEALGEKEAQSILAHLEIEWGDDE